MKKSSTEHDAASADSPANNAKPETASTEQPEGNFPIVCLGGSAGGLKPYTEVLQQIPAYAGISVVVVNHARRKQTILPQILAKNTSMPVEVITTGLTIRVNHVYVIPPNQDLTLHDGSFRLTPLSQQRGWPKVITVFLQSLAEQWKGKVIAAILSGLDSDGVAGLRLVKAAGGITFAQTIETAAHPSMPEEAIKTGCVDFELPPAEIGRELTRIALEHSGKADVELNEQNKVQGSSALLDRLEPSEEAKSGQAAAASFPVVGIGASAGGLEAFTLLFERLPAHTGMAFVLVQHLQPTHESQLTEILSRKSNMPVCEVHGDTLVEPDHVYVIPAAKNLTIANGILRTIPRPEPGSRNMPIDGFLEALGKDRQHRAFAVILSGTASDGTLGVRSVKAEGGITFAQDPRSAKFDGMPRSAIASGAIDFVLSPDAIAKQLVELSTRPYLHIGLAPDTNEVNGQDLDLIFARLRMVAGIDFTYYKRNTILRRIKRRMALQDIDDVKEYCSLIDKDSTEAKVLAQDFLVNVTSFFREPEVHLKIREVLFPSWLQGRSTNDPIRIWTPGCSTGEEAYSLAITMTELLEEHNAQIPLQIFATDLSTMAIEKARAGVYLENALGGVTRERLERFFVKRDRVYQVSQAIRDICVFARHDVTKDPPFSRMDLISCCNLLIYLGPVLQKKALSLFHYALKPNGFLILGSSESVGTSSESYETIDRKHKIFSKRGISARPNFDVLSENTAQGIVAVQKVIGESSGLSNGVQKEAERMLLAEYAPASVIIDEAMHVLQVRGQTDPYLQIPQGTPTTYLMSMVRPGLLAGVKTAVEQARRQNFTSIEKGLRLKEAQGVRTVTVRVSPIRGLQEKDRCFLVLFEDSTERKTPIQESRKRGRPGSDPEATARLQQEIARLEQELSGTRDYLQSIIETQEASAEELRSANEEAQANNEELDTAKEELQASNEELNTVNEELRIRNAEQNSLNGDLRKLLESINVPLVMVGKDLRIRWFTAAMEPVLNLLPTDQGRQITDLRATLIPDLVGMLVRAFGGTREKSIEFQRPNGGWLSLRILPYRGPENTIDGAIATLIDIDDLKRARDFAQAVVETVREPLIVLDADLRVRAANDAFYKIFEVDKASTEGHLFYEIEEGRWNLPKLRRLLDEVLPKETSLKDFEIDQRTHKFGGPKTMRLNAREIRRHDGERMILLAIDDITELRRSVEKFRQSNDDLKQFIFAASHDLSEPLRMIVAHTQLLASKYADRLDEPGRVSAGYVVDGALRMGALISGLRQFWELSEGDEEQHVPVNSAEVLKKVLLNLETSIAETKAIITSEYLPVVKASEATLIQLFQNLLANALTYRTDEPPVIQVSAKREESEWIFSVRDNGIGINPQYARQIFGVFKRLHPHSKYSGTGIGLALCQKIVERYGGRIWVESQPGEGSNFKFTFPV